MIELSESYDVYWSYPITKERIVTSENTSKNKGYLKGNAKNWFWPAGAVLLWMLIWSAVSPTLYSSLLGRMASSSNIVFIAAGIQTFLHTAAWVMMGVSYGLYNKIKAFKIIFLVVAGIQLIGFYSHFASNFAVAHILYANGPMNSVVNAYTLAMSLLLNGAWVVFTLIAICHKKTGKTLRAASILLLAARIIKIVCNYASGTFYPRLVENTSVQTAAIVIGLAGHVVNILAYGSLIFFFGAMAFSRSRGTDAMTA